MEEFFDDNGTYAGATAATLFKSSGTDVGATKEVVVAIASAGTQGYCLTANHSKLTATGVDYVFDIANGTPTEALACTNNSAAAP